MILNGPDKTREWVKVTSNKNGESARKGLVNMSSKGERSFLPLRECASGKVAVHLESQAEDLGKL